MDGFRGRALRASRWVAGCALAMGLSAGWTAEPAKSSDSRSPQAADGQEKTAPDSAGAAKEPSLAAQIRDALDGRGGATLNLGKSAKEKALATAPKPAARARAPSPGGHRPGAWGYGGVHGPEGWAGLDPGYALCGAGERQSPIHIESKSALRGPSDDLEFRYKPTAGSVVNNGHTFQVDLAEGSELVARGEVYRLEHIQFHHPSEEKIDYKGFAMAAHLVHRSDTGRLAVVAVELDMGEPNAAVARAWRSLPLDAGDKSGMGAAGLDASELLPPEGKRKYFQFMGSLTTPPCTEEVLWLVLKTPMTVSSGQVDIFTRFFPMNARPVQPVHGRLIREQE